MDVLEKIVIFSLLCFGMFEVCGSTITCANCEFYYVEINYPLQGMPVYAQPSYSAAGQLLYNYAPKITPIHVFQIAGAQKICSVVKVMKVGIFPNLVVEITNLGMEVYAIPLYSFESHALSLAVTPLLAFEPVRILPCPRVYMMEMEVAPLGNKTEYKHALHNFTAEILRLRKVGIVFDVYKFLTRIPAMYMMFACGTPTFMDQLTLGFGSFAHDYAALTVGSVYALTKWNPLIGGKSGSCYWGSSAAGMFLKKKRK